jgi:hypothetical protein
MCIPPGKILGTPLSAGTPQCSNIKQNQKHRKGITKFEGFFHHHQKQASVLKNKGYL